MDFHVLIEETFTLLFKMEKSTPLLGGGVAFSQIGERTCVDVQTSICLVDASRLACWLMNTF